MRTDLSLATSDPTVSPYFTSSNDADDDESSCSTTGESRDNQSTADSVCNLDPDETTSKNHQPSLQQSQVAASSMLPGRRLTYSFYNQECVTLAKALLGKWIFFIECIWYPVIILEWLDSCLDNLI